jgi:hypothetical protein
MSFQGQFNAQNTTARGQNISKGQSQIILTQDNIVSTDGSNSTLRYVFPSSVSFTNHAIALVSAQMYYSWNNISNQQTLLNNTFSYTWTVASNPTVVYNVVIPNGIYEVADINNYFQFVMIQNGHYLIDSAGLNVFYAEFLVSTNRYAVNINTFPVPIALPATWTAPLANVAAGYLAFAGFPNTTFNPSITLPANFNKIVGYAAGFFTSQNVSFGTNLSYFSSVAPAVQPNPSIFLSCSNINNIYANPSGLIYAITPSVAIGEVIREQPPEYAYSILTGTTSQLTFTLRGTNQSIVNILDPLMSFTFVIKELGAGF